MTMRLDDINAFLDVRSAYIRLAKRAGLHVEEDVQFMTISELREAATATDSSIRREPMKYGADGVIFRFTYRGVDFWYMSHGGEVE